MMTALVRFVERHELKIFGGIVLLVLSAGTAYSIHAGSRLQYGDERDYYSIARNLSSAGLYSYDGRNPDVFRPPGMPFLIAGMMILGAGTVCLRILGFLAFALCICILYAILRHISTRFAAVIGVLLVVCYPVLFYTAGTLYPQTVCSLLLLVIKFIIAKGWNSTTAAAVSGLLSGYLVLIAPSFLFVLPMIALWIWVTGRPNRAKTLAIAGVAAVLVVIPWTLRNYAIFHKFVPVSANSGIMMLYGNSEGTTPNSGPDVDIAKYRCHTSGMNDAEIDAYYRSAAIEYILSHKSRSAGLYFLKLLNNFNYRNDLKTKAESSSTKDLVMLLTYGPLLLVFLLRLACWKRLPMSNYERMMVLLYFSAAVFNAIFFTRIRYRLPFDFLLIIVVAKFIDDTIVAHMRRPGRYLSTQPMDMVGHTQEKG
jgi:4-amino-4-deoxy-L-arabinose transferase-like glycosyltransferase